MNRHVANQVLSPRDNTDRTSRNDAIPCHRLTLRHRPIESKLHGAVPYARHDTPPTVHCNQHLTRLGVTDLTQQIATPRVNSNQLCTLRDRPHVTRPNATKHFAPTLRIKPSRREAHRLPTERHDLTIRPTRINPSRHRPDCTFRHDSPRNLSPPNSTERPHFAALNTICRYDSSPTPRPETGHRKATPLRHATNRPNHARLYARYKSPQIDPTQRCVTARILTKRIDST